MKSPFKFDSVRAQKALATRNHRCYFCGNEGIDQGAWHEPDGFDEDGPIGYRVTGWLCDGHLRELKEGEGLFDPYQN